MLPIEGNKNFRDSNGLYTNDKIFQKLSELQGPSIGHKLLSPQNSYLTEQNAPNPEGGSRAEASMQTEIYSVFTQQMQTMRSFIESLDWH